MIRGILISAALCAAAVGAAPARADESTYVADLAAAGVPILRPPGQLVNAGYVLCGQLRNGEAPEVAANGFGAMNAWGHAIVDVTQHDLCPDTLH